MRAFGLTARTLMLGAVALIVPHLGVANEDSITQKQSPNSKSKISTVIATLKDILQSVNTEEVTETTSYNKFMNWCKNGGDDIANDLAATQSKLANSKVAYQEQTSSLDSLKLVITHSESEIEDAKDAVAQAVALRTDENQKYTEDMLTNAQGLRQISVAIKHVGKVQQQGGFLQNGVKQKLQINQPGESSYVLGVMKGLQEKLSSSRQSLQQTEAEKVTMHNTFIQTKSNAIKLLVDATTDKKIAFAETSARQLGEKQNVAKLTADVEKMFKSASSSKQTCESTEQEWKVRQADRANEKAALAEAIRYLKDIALEQLTAVQGKPMNSDDEEHASVVFAPSFLQTDSEADAEDSTDEEGGDAALVGEVADVADRMEKDTYTGVKDVVAKLISTHQVTQKEESTKKQYCGKEIEAKEDEKEDTSNTLAAVNADIDRKTSEVEVAVSEIAELNAAIANVKKSLEIAAKLRKEEAGIFEAGTKDRALAIKVLNQAKAVLQAFYKKKGANLLQQSRPTTQPTPTVCADAQGKTCACNGDVYYGLKFFNNKPGNGRLSTFARVQQSPYVKKTVTGSIQCSTSAMGKDPLPGYHKYCFCVVAPAGGPPPAKWSNASPRKQTASFGAVSMVQNIADDIAKEQKDASVQEQKATAAFTTLQQDGRETTDNKQQEITDRTVTKAKLGVQINTLKETQTEKSEDLNAINKQLSALHKECDQLFKYYDDNKKARTFEVSQLRDVMDILSGSSIAARTGATPGVTPGGRVMNR